MSELLDLELPELADEELAFLEGGHREERLVDLTTIEGLDHEAWEVAVSEGLRSLLDRRLLSTADEPERPPRLCAELETILAVRRLPWLVVLLERIDHERRSTWTVYGVDEGVVLLETIVSPGRHAFRLSAVELVVSWLAAFADPDDVAREGSEPLAERAAIEQAVGTPRTLTRVFAARRADEDLPTEWEATLAASDRGLWAIRDGADGDVLGWSLSAADRADLFARLLELDG